VSLLDEDAAVHEFGRAATKLHPERVVTDTRRVLYQEQLPATSNPMLTTVGERPQFGVLQVIAALPDEQALALTREMLGQRDPRLRALALAASSTMDDFGTLGMPTPGVSRTEVETLRTVVRDGEWLKAGVPMASVQRIQTDADHRPVRDANGNALGGWRLPQLDLPLAAYAGTGTPRDNSDRARTSCALTGVKRPFTTAQLKALYGDRNAWLQQFRTAVEQAVAERRLTAEDGEALKAPAVRTLPAF
jgi:hypothetical protein